MKPDEQIRTAFHEVISSLLGLFEVYEAPAELVDHMAVEIEEILQRYLKGSGDRAMKGKLALEQLLDELEAQSPSLFGFNS